MNIKMRQTIERRIIGAFVRDALKAGYPLTVSLERGYDIEEGNPMLGCTDYKKIMEEATAGDECHIFVHKSKPFRIPNGALNTNSWVFCVFGNDGYDVISDYTVDLEPLMKRANEISGKYA